MFRDLVMNRPEANTYFSAIMGPLSGLLLITSTFHPRSTIAANIIIASYLIGGGAFNFHQAYKYRRVHQGQPKDNSSQPAP